MGLFSALEGYQKQDYELALELAKIATEWWNVDLCDMYGFTIYVSARSLDDCCAKAASIFDVEPRYFANPPGPYKRVAAFLVLGCLEPFFGFKPHVKEPSRRVAFPITDYDRRVWHVRFLIWLLPGLIGRLQVTLDGKSEEVHWGGFPSAHFQLEFMNWLKWLDRFTDLKDLVQQKMEWEDFDKKRLARMVMATALALEASSYTDANNPLGIQGKINGCMSKLNDIQREDLYYEFVPGY